MKNNRSQTQTVFYSRECMLPPLCKNCDRFIVPLSLIPTLTVVEAVLNLPMQMAQELNVRHA